MIRPIILCKAPVEGQVKTRLMPALSAQQACALHQRMAYHFITRVHLWYPNAWLAVDDPKHLFFQQFKMPLLAQGKGDLGQKMQRLMRLNLASGAQSSLFLGTDSPHISRHRLQAAYAATKYHQVVFAPVEDGGYQMLGVQGDQPALFQAIPWGTSQVMSASLAQAEKYQLSVHQLSMSFDVDYVEDVKRLYDHAHLFKFGRLIW